MTGSVIAPARSEALPVSYVGVGRSFGAHTVISGIDLDVQPGHIVSILGPSGCGKSTLLRATAGLDRPTTGGVRIDGEWVRGIDPQVAVAFQESRLLPWRTLRANVELGLPRGTDRRAGRARVEELLALVGLAEYGDHRPREVSGGMAQRTSLARALAREPGVLVLDEPFGALDALTKMKMQDLLLTVHAAKPCTVVLVTHDVDEALQLSDEVVVLGRPSPSDPATIVDVVPVPGERPRDRGSVELAGLRGRLLEQLGVDSHRH